MGRNQPPRFSGPDRRANRPRHPRKLQPNPEQRADCLSSTKAEAGRKLREESLKPAEAASKTEECAVV